MALFLAPLIEVVVPGGDPLFEEDGVTLQDPPAFSAERRWTEPGAEIVGDWAGIPAPGGIPWILVDAPAMTDSPAGCFLLPDGMATALSNPEANAVGQAYGLNNAATRALRGLPVGEVFYTLQGVEPAARNGKRRMHIGSRTIHEVDG